MKPLLLHHYYGVMDGVFASMIDLYYNLSKYIDIDFSITTDTPKECIEHLFKNNSGDLVNKITINKNFENDIIVCSARLLYDEYCKLKCNKLLIQDSLDLSKYIYGVHPDIRFYIPTDILNENIIFLCNPANIIPNREYIQLKYYQKLSKERLDKLPRYYIRFLEDYNLKKRFLHKNYQYRRNVKLYIEVQRNKYFENFGRLIFEHIYHNKKVNYYTDGMFVKDGLSYYLELFDIDPTISHTPLLIAKEMIEEKLFMNEHDKILRLI